VTETLNDPTRTVASERPKTTRIVEIDGLRGIALTLVVFFHLFGQGRVSGGVDVFLFVSGVVLALSLMNDVARGTQGRVLSRWVRTFGRLAAPASLVLLATIVMSYTVLPAWNRSQTLLETISSAFYMENWQLIWSQLSYGAAGPGTSPIQHFWSLSIQGQMIIVAPLAVAGVYALGSIVRKPATTLWTLTVVGTAASFVYAIYTRSIDPDVAYFDTFARAWQIGLGVLLAGFLRVGAGLPGLVKGIAGWAGLAVIVVSGLLIDGATAYPGPAALVPIGGAVLVILSAGGAGWASSSTLLSSRPFRLLSRYSYALFLWHWPVLIGFLTLPGKQDGRVGWKGAIAILTVSAVLAVATQIIVERPVQRLLASGRSMRATAFVIASILLVPLVAAPLLFMSQQERTIAVTDDCAGAAALDPERPECTNEFDPEEPLIPLLSDLSRDDANRPECWARRVSTDLNVCSLGPETGYTKHLFAVGDSHNNALIGAYEQIADAYNWRIDVTGRAACHWTHASRYQRNLETAHLCRDWNDAIDEIVSTTEFDAIIVTNSATAKYRPRGAPTAAEARSDGFVDAWNTRLDQKTPVISIRDNPLFPSEEMTCLQDLSVISAGGCAFPREEVHHDEGLQEASSRDPHFHHVDLSDYICLENVCPLVVGGVVVVRSDGLHLTATYARTLAPYLGVELSSIVGP
jgi:peptidoglycan/LPS O-acetylase OafA/YrhL